MICDKLNMPNLFFLLAVLLSTGCSGSGDEDFLIEEIPVVTTPEVQTPDDGVIRFKVGTGWQTSGKTRTDFYTDAASLESDGSFLTYAYVGSTTTAYINGSTVNYTGGEWIFADGKHYWPQTESLNFVTYMPASRPSYIGTPSYTVEGGPSFTCIDLPVTSGGQEGFKEYIYAYETGKTKAANAANMSLTFRRPFANVYLRLSRAHSDLTINSITFKNIYNNGTFVYGNSPQWTPSGSKTDFTATIASYSNTGSSPIALGGPYLLLPQNFGGTQTIEVSATWAGWSPSTQTLSTTFSTDAWTPGRSYTYTFTISEASITVSISDWGNDGTWTDPNETIYF